MGRVLVIGASGNIGRHVVSQLAGAGACIRVLSRKSETARLPPQVEVVRGDLTVPESLDACLNEVDSVFLVWTAPPETVTRVIKRIASRARRIVFLSTPHNIEHPLFQSAQPNAMAEMQKQIERSIVESGLEWTFLRPGMLAGNALYWWAAQIRAGDVVRWPYLAAPTAPIEEGDIAAVAVRALCEPGHASAEYVLTGPQSLTQFDQISTIGRAIRRKLRVEEISPERARNELFSAWPDREADMLLTAWAAATGQPALVTSTVPEITGAPARTFFEWATGHASHFSRLTASAT